MTQRFHMPPSDPLPPDAEVVWNGTHDKALSQYWQQQAQRPPELAHPGFGQPVRASLDPASTRDCDRVLRYLVSNRFAAHTPRSVATACGISARTASTWLGRFTQRGVLAAADDVPRTPTSGRSAHVYRVRPMELP